MGTAGETFWRKIGVWSAATVGASFLLSMIMILFVVGAVSRPEAGDAAAGLAYHQATAPWASLALLQLALGFLALAPLGLALRARYGRAAGPWDLIALLFGAAAVLETAVLLLQAASKVAVVMLGGGATAARVSQLLVVNEVTELFGLVFAFFTFIMFAAGLGLIAVQVLTGRSAEGLPRAWAWVAVAAAAMFVVGQIGIAAGAAGVGLAGRGLAMMILIPIWGLWLAMILHADRNNAAAAD